MNGFNKRKIDIVDRTNTGYILIWTSVWLWGLYAATRILGIK